MSLSPESNFAIAVDGLAVVVGIGIAMQIAGRCARSQRRVWLLAWTKILGPGHYDQSSDLFK